MYRGDIRLGETIDIKFTTRQISGAPSTLGGTPVISAYVGNGTTQITAGITLTVDFDSVTGLNNVRVVATSGNGFATATNVDLVITTGTVNSVSVVGEVIGSFSIEARSALMPTTVARTLDVSAGGEAGVDWANVGSPTTAVNLSATNIDVDQVVASVSGAVGSVTGAVGSVTGAVGSVTGAVGSVTGNVGGNVTGSVGSVTGLTNATIADAVWDEDATAHQTQGTFGQAIGDPGADTDTIFGLVNTNLDAAVSSRLSSAGYTAPDNTSIAAILVDTAEIGAAGAGLTVLATQASVNTIDDFLDTEIAAIKAKTDNLPAAPAAVGDIPTAVQNADALLDRNVSGGSSTGRQVKQALHVLRNKTEIGAGTLTVYDVDDTTPSFTAAVTTTAGDPITAIDPA